MGQGIANYLATSILFFVLLGCSSVPSDGVGKANEAEIEYCNRTLQNGDVLFRMGYGAVSEWINQRQKSKFNVSHAGIAAQIQGKWMVVHSISGMLEAQDGVQISTLPQFILEAQPKSVFIMRYNLSKSKRLAAAKTALQYWQQGIRFDHQFNSDDSTAMYCSELIFYSYRSILPQLQANHPDYDFQALTDTSLGKLIGLSIPRK